MALIQGRPLILYTAALEWSLGAMLAQCNDKGKENALYYISWTMVGAEVNYSSMEKICLALFFSVQKLRHYLICHQIILISKADLLWCILSKHMLSGRFAKWARLLAPFDIKFMLQKAVKGQAITDFLAAHLCTDNEELPDDCQTIKLCL